MKLNNLEIGDSVTVRRLGVIQSIEKITRKTKTQIITNMGRKFNIDTGFQIPGDRGCTICTSTVEDRKYFKRKQMVDKLMAFSFERLSYEQLENVIKAIGDKNL